MKAFQGAVEVGAHAVETDIHLSKDDVVVLSHVGHLLLAGSHDQRMIDARQDGDLKRCFGQKEKIIDCDWDYLSTLRTLKAPHEPMPRLRDLLAYVAQPGLEHIWLLLDIKLDNNSDKVMRLIAETLAAVNPGQRAWNQRVVLGIWAAKFLPLCIQYLPGYPVSHIGFSTTYARQFLKVPNVSFNMLQKVLLGPVGARFMRDVRRANRALFVWTVNDANLMKWSIQKRVDGVITDDPKKFNQIRRDWEDDEEKATARLSLMQWLYTLWLWMMIGAFSIPFKRRFPETVEQFIKNDLRAKATLTLGETEE